jgi:predicted hydrolase (HD superfamily)
LELPSVKKKYKDKKFAAGCSREVIESGAQLLGWELDDLITKTILAMRENEVLSTGGTGRQTNAG